MKKKINRNWEYRVPDEIGWIIILSIWLSYIFGIMIGLILGINLK